jgi:hypothetical protein
VLRLLGRADLFLPLSSGGAFVVRPWPRLRIPSSNQTCRFPQSDHCAGKRIENGRGLYRLNVGAIPIDDAAAQGVLTALAPRGIEAARDEALAQ